MTQSNYVECGLIDIPLLQLVNINDTKKSKTDPPTYEHYAPHFHQCTHASQLQRTGKFFPANSRNQQSMTCRIHRPHSAHIPSTNFSKSMPATARTVSKISPSHTSNCIITRDFYSKHTASTNTTKQHRKTIKDNCPNDREMKHQQGL